MRLNIRLAPNAGRNEISGFDAQGVLKIRVTAKPMDGRANEALIALLAKELRIPKSAIGIVQGQASKNKVIEISGINRLPEEYYGKAAR